MFTGVIMVCINELQVFQLSQEVNEKLNTDFSGALDSQQNAIQLHQNALMWFVVLLIGYGGTRVSLNINEGGQLTLLK